MKKYSKFIEKEITDLGITNEDDLLKNVELFYSSSKNLFLITFNGKLLYKTSFNPKNNFLNNLEIIYNNNDFFQTKIKSKYNQNNNSSKISKCSFTNDYIYFLTSKTDEIFYCPISILLNNTQLNNDNSLYIPLPTKKKVKNISCTSDFLLFLTFAGIVYQLSDNKNNIMLTELLNYNISSISTGEKHCLCVGSDRNSNNTNKYIFSWGDNNLYQCGIDNLKNIAKPKLLFKSKNIEKISTGSFHNIILFNNGNVLFFGDNKYNQCSSENKKYILLPKIDYLNEEIDKYTVTNEYINRMGETINKIKAKDNSSLLITNKGSLFFMGKIFNKKQKIFILENNDINYVKHVISFSDDFFIILKNDKIPSLYKEIENNNQSFTPINNSKINRIRKICLSQSKNQSNGLKKFRINKNNFSFANLQKERNSSVINKSRDNSLNELKDYIKLLGISFSSTYDDSQLSFRPSNLPPKSIDEINLHRKMVHRNREIYIHSLKLKQELTKTQLFNLEQLKLKKEKTTAYWLNEIIPNWNFYSKNSQIIKKYFYNGIPDTIRGKIWMLCIGNKSCITREFYEIGVKKSIEILLNLNKKENINSYNNKKNEIDDENKNNISILSDNTKKKYAQYISQTLDKEKSIKIIDLDINRTFASLSIFKTGTPLSEDLKEILRVFVVTRPDMGYVQGLSYIAAVLLMQMEKFQAFVTFCNIILSPDIFAFYKLDENGIRKRLDIFNEIFECNLQKLYNHFNICSIFPEHYLLEWIMTLYTRTFHIDLVVRIWDVFMIEGIISLYKIAIVVLTYIEKELINSEFSEILSRLREIKKIKFDEDQFIKKMNDVKLTDKIFNKVNQFNEEYLPVE